MVPLDLTGKVFGRLKIVRRAPNIGRYTAWLCRCTCGTEKAIRTDHLARGAVVSCFAPGCHKTSHKHGLTKDGARPADYSLWAGMKDRCVNPNSEAYPDYGGRGIRVCERWAYNFADFMADMGPRPAGTSIDRIDNDGNYEPGNCRWANRRQQAQNRRNSLIIDFDGRKVPLIEAARECGISYFTAYSRYQNGRDIRDVKRRTANA